MAAQQRTLKVTCLPEGATRERVKEYFQEIVSSTTSPSVVVQGRTAIVVYNSAEDAATALNTEHTMDDVKIKVVQMPPPYLGDTAVTVAKKWQDTFSAREDVRLRLEKEHNISSLCRNGKWTLAGNFYVIQNLHRVLEDLLPEMEIDASQMPTEEFVVVGGESELPEGTREVRGDKTGSTVEPDFDMLSDDLYTEENKTEAKKEEDKDVQGLGPALCDDEAGTQDDAVQLPLHHGSDSKADEPSTPSEGVEDTQVLPVKVDFSSHRKSPVSSLTRYQTEPAEQFAEPNVPVISRVTKTSAKAVAAPRSSETGDLAEAAALLCVQVFLMVPVGVYKFLKNRRSDSLRDIRDSCNVEFAEIRTDSERKQKIEIKQKDISKLATVYEAQKRLEQLCVEVSQSVFQLDDIVTKSKEMGNLLKDISQIFPDIIVCHKAGNVLIAGPERFVSRAEEKIRQGCENIREKLRPSAVRARKTKPQASATDVKAISESSDLVQQLIDRGGATPSVMNDIFNASSQNQSVQRLSLTDQQPDSDTEFPLVRHDDFVRVAEQSNAAGVPVVSPAHVPDEAHSDAVCSFCGETDAATLTKLNNCPDVLCSECMGPAKHHGFCPVCEEPIVESTLPVGMQPKGGKMTEEVETDKLPGFENSKGTIIITYEIPDGVQTQNHPRPGIPYKGTKKRAYLPDTAKGREVLRMLRVAFRHRLTFAVEGDQVQWSTVITHKTEFTRNKLRGYPDDTYLDRVTEELGAFGIDMDYVRKQYGSPAGGLDYAGDSVS